MNIVLYLLKIFSVYFTILFLSSNAFAKDEKKLTPTKITLLLDWKPNTNHTGFYVAKNLGYFKDAGMDVTIINPSQTSVSTLVGRGKAEFGISYATNLINAREAGIPLVGIASLEQSDSSCFVWRKSSEIKSIKDFEGKRYASLGGTEEFAMIKYIMEKNGADFSKLKFVTIGMSDFLQITEKNADITWEYKSWGILSAKLRGVEVDSYCISDNFKDLKKPSPLLITSEKLLKDNPELVKKFLKATQKGYEFAIKHPKESAKILVAEVPGLDENFMIESQQVISPNYQGDAPYWGYIAPEQFKSYEDWMYESKLIKTKPNLNLFIINLFEQ